MTTVSVRYIVDDVEAAVAFYTRHLDFGVELPRRTVAHPQGQDTLKRISTISLSWAARSLDLPPWQGVHWREIR